MNAIVSLESKARRLCLIWSVRQQKKMKRGTTIGTALAGLLGVLLLLSCFPIMQVTDGCECGYRRTWYEMPESLWHRHRFCMRIENAGNPTHAHRLWDAQWGVWLKLPWQK